MPLKPGERDLSPDKIEVPAPRPADEETARLEARVRTKLARDEPLDAEEQAFFARMAADEEIPPGKIRIAQEAGLAPRPEPALRAPKDAEREERSS